MPTIFLILASSVLLSSLAYSAKDPAQLSEAELKRIAVRELSMVSGEGSMAPFAAPDSGLVSTTEAVKKESKELKAPSEFELGLQTYRPVGFGRISPAETYSYDSLSAKPMLLLGGRHWFFRDGLKAPIPWRAGLGAEAGLTSHELAIRTSQGKVHDNVRLNHFFALAGPEWEVFLGRSLQWALGLRAMAGRAFVSQASSTPALDDTSSSGLWEGAAHLRFQPSQKFFARLAYARRGILGSSDGLGTQEHNYAALLGFGM